MNLLHAGEEGALQDERDEELHARLVEARLASGEARAMAGVRSGGLGMGAVRRTASAHSAAAARTRSLRARGGSARASGRCWTASARTLRPAGARGNRGRGASRLSENSYVLAQLGAGGSPLNSAPTSAHATMSASSARDLAAELKLQDVMLSSQTLSGAAGRAGRRAPARARFSPAGLAARVARAAPFGGGQAGARQAAQRRGGKAGRTRRR